MPGLILYGSAESSLLCRLFSTCGERGSSLAGMCGRLLLQIMGSSAHQLLELEHLGSVVVAPGFWGTGSVAVAQGLSCSKACGIFPG